MSTKKRLDAAVFEQGFCDSREKAKTLIMAGVVYVNNQKADKPGIQIKDDDSIEVRSNPLKYVSRGGLKLEKAMSGFTDCMLQNGAKKVYSIDVGYGQLAWKLRTDPRVVNMERTNFRYVTKEQVPDELSFASVDVSFISLSLIVPVMRTLMRNDAYAVCLIKPQFEAGRDKIGKKGVVRDKSVHIEVVDNIIGMMLNNGFSVSGLDYSPVKGPEGNIEYLLYMENDNREPVTIDEKQKEAVKELVAHAHEVL